MLKDKEDHSLSRDVIVAIISALITGVITFSTTYYFHQKDKEDIDARWVTALSHISSVVQEGMGRETAIQLLEEQVKTLEKNAQDSKNGMEGLTADYNVMSDKCDKLDSEYKAISDKYDKLDFEYKAISDKYSRLKDFLLQKYSAKDIEYVEEGGIIEKQSTDTIGDLNILDRMQSERIDGFEDCFGDTHGASIRFYYSGEIRFALNKKYDILTLTPFTSSSSSDSTTRFEFYVDDELIESIEKVEKGKRYDSVSINVSNGDVLKIKAIMMPNDWNPVFLSDISLSCIS